MLCSQSVVTRSSQLEKVTGAFGVAAGGNFVRFLCDRLPNQLWKNKNKAIINTMSLYTALELDYTASELEIRDAFTKVARSRNPDRNMGSENWSSINEQFAFLLFAYKILRNPETKRMYDAYGFPGLKKLGIAVPSGYQSFMPSAQGESSSESSLDGLVDSFAKLNTKTGGNGTYHCGSRTRITRSRTSDFFKNRYVSKTRQANYRSSLFGAYGFSLSDHDFADYRNLIKVAWAKELAPNRRYR